MNENIKPSKLWMNATLTHEKIEIIIIISLNFNLLIKFEFGSSLHWTSHSFEAQKQGCKFRAMAKTFATSYY